VCLVEVHQVFGAGRLCSEPSPWMHWYRYYGALAPNAPMKAA